MRIQIEAPFQVSTPMQQFIEEKVEKMDTIFNKILSVQIHLKDVIQRHHHKDNRIAQVKINVPGQTIFADAEAESFEKAIAAAVDKGKRQLRKFKTQLADHR